MLFSYFETLPRDILFSFYLVALMLAVTILGAILLTVLDKKIWDVNRLRLNQARLAFLFAIFWCSFQAISSVTTGFVFSLFAQLTNVTLLACAYMIYEEIILSPRTIKLHRWTTALVLVAFFFIGLVWFPTTSDHDRGLRAIFVQSVFIYFTLSSVLIGLIRWNIRTRIERAMTGIWILSMAIFLLHFFNYSPDIPQIYNALLVFLISLLLSIGFLLASVSNLALQLIEKVSDLSFTDYLTGLKNRRYFFDNISSAISLANRHGKPCTIAIFDLDDFKTVNDQYGHDLGDQALKKFSRVMIQTFREHNMLVRWGGEEFLVFFPMTSASEAQEACNRFLDALSDVCLSNSNGQLRITASIGISELESFEQLEVAISKADQALYAAKENGKNQCHACLAG